MTMMTLMIIILTIIVIILILIIICYDQYLIYCKSTEIMDLIKVCVRVTIININILLS